MCVSQPFRGVCSERAAGNHTYLVKKNGNERRSRSLYQLVHVRAPLAMLSLDNRMANPTAGVLMSKRDPRSSPRGRLVTGAALAQFS